MVYQNHRSRTYQFPAAFCKGAAKHHLLLYVLPEDQSSKDAD